MKIDYIKILKAMKEVGIVIEDPDLSKSTRIFIQKFTYLLKNLGFEITGYEDYNFYLNGVYSPQLTQDYYKFSINLVEDPSISLTRADLDLLERYKHNIFNHPYFQSHKIEFHEALTTLQYLSEIYPELIEKDLLLGAKDLKKHLSRKILVLSLNIIKKMKFQQEMVTPSIQEELSLWDSLNDGE
ncbi:MAG: hypothetical protein ACTSVL_12680 [Promethearchaeota archaeon]